MGTVAGNEPNFDRVFDLEAIRVNLLLFSLYLTAYEILKSAIIDNIADAFVSEARTKADVQAARAEYEALLSQHALASEEQVALVERIFGNQETYEDQVEEYESILGSGLRYENRGQYGLLPSCEYLRESGVLTNEEVEEVKKLRDHRNRLAHELPELLTSKGFRVDLDRLQRIRELLVKVEVFWARFHISIEHPEVYDLPDEDIFAGRVFLMDQILRAVAEHIDQVGQAGPQSPEHS